MQVSILHPPNLQTLSPDVIGSVVQRSRIPLYRHTTTSLAPVTTALVEPCPFTQAEDDCSGRSSPTDTKQSDKKRASAAEGTDRYRRLSARKASSEARTLQGTTTQARRRTGGWQPAATG
ncbi:unnamed protein product [Phytophthora lilii]|uniref:Unnamed protein product n=1 Tax=Phytophthora lilii TaxID=2077276 RepID=A0A9W6TCL9_9STRA|nr:unnamed protein product [Phytophthora lilii]